MQKRTVALLGAASVAAATGVSAWRLRERPTGQSVLDLTKRGTKPRVVIVGAGFAGLAAAARLAKARDEVETVVLDQHNYNVFSPLLYHLAASLVDLEAITVPMRTVAYRTGFTFQQATVTRVDVERRELQTDVGPVVYDYLILCPGSVTTFFGLDSAKKYSYPLKSVMDASQIRSKVLEGLEAASKTTDPAERRRHLSIGIVGGGPTGLELAGALVALVKDLAGHEYPNLHPSDATVTVFEALPSVLPGMPDELKTGAVEQLRARGVTVRTGVPVADVTPTEIVLRNGERFPMGLIVWAAGVEGSPLLRDLPAEHLRNQRVVVEPTLNIPGHENVYVVGDSAAGSPGKTYPAVAPVAIQMAHTAADNILRHIHGRSLQPFEYHDRGNLVMTGRYAAVASVYGIKFDGFPAWFLWRALHLSWLTTFRSKAEVLLDWAFVYIGPRQTALVEQPVPTTDVAIGTGKG
jgi:NADH dehydrogenase